MLDRAFHIIDNFFEIVVFIVIFLCNLLQFFFLLLCGVVYALVYVVKEGGKEILFKLKYRDHNL